MTKEMELQKIKAVMIAEFKVQLNDIERQIMLEKSIRSINESFDTFDAAKRLKLSEAKAL